VGFALPARLAPVGGQRLVDLAAAAGFAPDLRGDFVRPVMKFVPVDADAPGCGIPGAYSIEFLTPLVGRPDDPEGQPLVTADVQAGLSAQRLRYLDLLLEAPWTVAIGHLPGAPAGEPPLAVQLPHPGCFLVQKLLIADKRDPETERPKDLAYVYQVVQLFARDLPQLKRNPGRIVNQVGETRRPALLTSRGRGVAVVQALAEYEAESEERALLRGVVQGLMGLEEGREIDLSAVKRRLSLP
jgi:prevent-host-death family protein